MLTALHVDQFSASVERELASASGGIILAYQPHTHHRSQQYAGQKSQWTIPVADEHSCYSLSVQRQWRSSSDYYGLHLQGNEPVALGVTRLPEAHPVCIAKFVSANGADWHGYPAAHWLSPFDKPDDHVLQAWHASGLISMPKFRKIHGGKKCSL